MRGKACPYHYLVRRCETISGDFLNPVKFRYQIIPSCLSNVWDGVLGWILVVHAGSRLKRQDERTPLQGIRLIDSG